MIVQYTAFVISVDPFIGRVDKHSLSQQTLMELLIEGITENKEEILGNTNEIKDVFLWPGVKLNDAREVTEISWYCYDLIGTMELKWLPLSVEQVLLAQNKLTGTVDFTCLPDGLAHLSIYANRFYGTVDLTRLPPRLESLYIFKNDFCGHTDFSQMPKSLGILDVHDTQLEGEVRCDHISYLSVRGSNVKDMRGK